MTLTEKKDNFQDNLKHILIKSVESQMELKAKTVCLNIIKTIHEKQTQNKEKLHLCQSLFFNKVDKTFFDKVRSSLNHP